LGERIAAGVMLTAAAIIIVGAERSALISISHRRDASPTGKSPHNSCTRTGLTTDEPPKPMRAAASARLAHFVGCVDAQNGEPRRQHRDDSLNHGQPRLGKLCIIFDNEA